MKILFVYYVPSGGVETLARQRTEALAPKGVQFQFLFFAQGAGMQNIKEKTWITNDDTKIRTILASEKFDAIIVGSDYAFLERVRNLGFTGKLIYEVQGMGQFEEADVILEYAQPLINKHADAILYPKTPHLNTLIEKYYPLKKKFSFHNCIDTKNFSYVTEGLTTEPYMLLGWVGRFEDNKNWKEFLLLAAKLTSSYSNLRIWIFTDSNLNAPQEVTAFKRMVRSLDLSKYITIFSNVPHSKMPAYYSRIGNSGGMLCSTSKYEGFGYAIVEAMCCLCPVLTTDSDGIKSFIFHNVTGKIYRQGDVTRAAHEAIDLIHNAPLKAQIRQNAQQYIKQHFTPEIYAENFMEMLRAL
ncbi:glycosyltransferase family 4 protein [Rossellomorea vietnamensis]|uniref:Glycosyltransferase family 4 protein n=1 Tax=Rossellomorea vietnamensis TaxID=218284 RepID=A0A5D4NNX4_9BACI|nr:glycosyltransferase family 4 protein [Rossellomorea vietnamensis]TYS15188.1 glycosyltransferase family 4 protein [Rossellomorea vietnamensis]